jgi:hypothetical protein
VVRLTTSEDVAGKFLKEISIVQSILLIFARAIALADCLYSTEVSATIAMRFILGIGDIDANECSQKFEIPPLNFRYRFHTCVAIRQEKLDGIACCKVEINLYSSHST